VIENIFSAEQAGRAAGDHDAFVKAGAGFGDGRGFQVEVDVIGDEEIEMAVAIVVHEGTAGVPALAGGGDAGFFADVGEGAVAIVVIENIFAEVGDEEIVETVVVVIADADALSPAGVREAGFGGDIGESAVAIIFEEMRGGLLAGGEAFEARAVDEKNVEPAVVVVVVEGDAAAGGFEEIFVFVLAAEDGFGVEAGFAGNVEEGDAEIGGGSRDSGLLWRCYCRLERGQPFFGQREGEDFFEREHKGGAAERLEKCAARWRQKKRYLSLRGSC